MTKEVLNNLKNYILKYHKLIFIIFLLIIILIISFIIWLKTPSKIDKNFKRINLENTDKLMIVAHPDDELLWGGAHLIEDDYLVVCITCGVDKLRVSEFKKVMKSTKDKYIMLGYPDKTNGKRNNWLNVKNDMIIDLEKILELKNWDLIVTHNPDGEYGHIHHKMISEFVTYLQDDKSKLYYFGHYYSKKNISQHQSEMTSISEKTLTQKRQLIGYYKTQKFIQTTFDHMYEHEDWQSYDEWMSDINEKSN